MAGSLTNRVEGKFHEVKGKIKEKVGKATNEPNLEVEGKTQKKIGQVEKVLGS